ncbi:MAG: nucleoside-diphosphate kinase [Promethearchaeota archaeon]
MERTLLVLKPDATMRRGVGAAVFERIFEALPDVTPLGFVERGVPKALAEQHYAIHKGKFFYPWLIQFIRVGKVVATILEGDNIVKRLRNVLGATFVEKAEPDSLRGKYGLVGGVNVAHASDEPDNAEKEIALWTRRTSLDIRSEGRGPLMAYIEKWRGTPIKATKQIREYCGEYAKLYSNRTLYKDLIAEQLIEECPDWPMRKIRSLADALLGNMDLDKQKA